MELDTIVSRYAEALEAVDATTNTQNVGRRGHRYLPGLKGLTEVQALRQADTAWNALHPTDFVDPLARRLGIRYPGLQGTRCDHVFTTVGAAAPPEWAVEIKNIAFVGNNGKKNGYAVSKVLSPYLSDRGVLHDAARLRYYELARRHAVVGYTFRYDGQTCDDATLRHPDAADTIAEIRAACAENGGSLDPRPLLDFAESILMMRGLTRGARAEAKFEAWRHPCGGRGVVFGWEIRRPELEPGFDPRHPW